MLGREGRPVVASQGPWGDSPDGGHISVHHHPPPLWHLAGLMRCVLALLQTATSDCTACSLPGPRGVISVTFAPHPTAPRLEERTRALLRRWLGSRQPMQDPQDAHLTLQGSPCGRSTQCSALRGTGRKPVWGLAGSGEDPDRHPGCCPHQLGPQRSAPQHPQGSWAPRD